VAVGFDPVGGRYFACVEVDDRDGGVVGDREDAFAGVVASGSEMVHASGAAEAHLPSEAGAILTQPIVAGRAGVAGREYDDSSFRHAIDCRLCHEPRPPFTAETLGPAG
jgi:hypothetical protein